MSEIVCLARRALAKGLCRHRLMLAPDCGLGFLPLDIAEQKLANMVGSRAWVAEIMICPQVEAAKELNK